MDYQVTFGGRPVKLEGRHCQVGEKAPSFTLTDAVLQPVPSDRFSGKVRIYSIFPSVDTSVCSLQNIRFNREASKLGDEVVVISIRWICPLRRNVSARPRGSTGCMSCRTTASWISA